MSATESNSTSGSAAKMNGSAKKCLPSAAVYVLILLPETWIALIGRASVPRSPMSILLHV